MTPTRQLSHPPPPASARQGKRKGRRGPLNGRQGGGGRGREASGGRGAEVGEAEAGGRPGAGDGARQAMPTFRKGLHPLHLSSDFPLFSTSFWHFCASFALANRCSFSTHSLAFLKAAFLIWPSLCIFL